MDIKLQSAPKIQELSEDVGHELPDDALSCVTAMLRFNAQAVPLREPSESGRPNCFGPEVVESPWNLMVSH